MYLYMKKCVESGPVVPLQESWLMSMLNKIPDHLKATKKQKQLIDEIVEEIKTNYESSTRKSMGMQVFKKRRKKKLSEILF